MRKIVARWDTTDPNNHGWYAEVIDDEGSVIDDSMKIGFPIDVDDYSHDDRLLLEGALRSAFPYYRIEVRS